MHAKCFSLGDCKCIRNLMVPVECSASLAASNCTCILYFTLVFWLGGRPKESPQKEQGRSKEKQSSASYKEVFNALALASSVCAISYNVAVHLFQRPGLVLVISTAITVCIASIVPTQLERLTTGGEIIATISLQMFFATVGTGADIQALCSTAPAIFLWSVIQVTIHLAVVLGVWCLTGRFHKSELLTASNAAVGGPTTALALTASKGWDALRLPGTQLLTLLHLKLAIAVKTVHVATIPTHRLSYMCSHTCRHPGWHLRELHCDICWRSTWTFALETTLWSGLIKSLPSCYAQLQKFFPGAVNAAKIERRKRR